MKPLSEQLANLSVRLKNTEDAAAAAQKEAHDKVVARVAQAQATAEEAVQKVNQNIKSASDTASAKWNGMKAKIAADMDDLNSKVAERKHDLTVKRAANYSQLLDEEASFAIDYAIASIEQAKVAVLDAIAGRLEVEKAKRTPDPNIRFVFGETAARRSFFFVCVIFTNVCFWPPSRTSLGHTFHGIDAKRGVFVPDVFSMSMAP